MTLQRSAWVTPDFGTGTGTVSHNTMGESGDQYTVVFTLCIGILLPTEPASGKGGGSEATPHTLTSRFRKIQCKTTVHVPPCIK
jgi:hypothetical protein